MQLVYRCILHCSPSDRPTDRHRGVQSVNNVACPPTDSSVHLLCVISREIAVNYVYTVHITCIYPCTHALLYALFRKKQKLDRFRMTWKMKSKQKVSTNVRTHLSIRLLGSIRSCIKFIRSGRVTLDCETNDRLLYLEMPVDAAETPHLERREKRRFFTLVFNPKTPCTYTYMQLQQSHFHRFS